MIPGFYRSPGIAAEVRGHAIERCQTTHQGLNLLRPCMSLRGAYRGSVNCVQRYYGITPQHVVASTCLVRAKMIACLGFATLPVDGSGAV